jgi:hypothetical protein
MNRVRGFEFLKRRNLGNFEHEDIKVDICLTEGDDASVVAMESIKFVEDLLYRRVQLSTNQTTMDLGNGAQVVVKETKAIEVKKEEAKPAEVKAEAVVKTKTPAKKETTIRTPAPKVEETPVEAAEEVKVEKKSKRLSTKEVVYDRGSDVHKNLLSTYLDDIYIGWNNGANLAKASKASRELNGAPFLDSEGQILGSFKEAFASYMK